MPDTSILAVRSRAQMRANYYTALMEVGQRSGETHYLTHCRTVVEQCNDMIAWCDAEIEFAKKAVARV